MNNAWQIHYHGSDTVGSMLERLERAAREHEQAMTELGEALQEAKGTAADAARDALAALEAAQDARDAAAERGA